VREEDRHVSAGLPRIRQTRSANCAIDGGTDHLGCCSHVRNTGAVTAYEIQPAVLVRGAASGYAGWADCPVPAVPVRIRVK
jgi:hypothetical protein